jgi:hypothetical protein
MNRAIGPSQIYRRWRSQLAHHAPGRSLPTSREHPTSQAGPRCRRDPTSDDAPGHDSRQKQGPRSRSGQSRQKLPAAIPGLLQSVLRQPNSPNHGTSPENCLPTLCKFSDWIQAHSVSFAHFSILPTSYNATKVPLSALRRPPIRVFTHRNEPRNRAIRAARRHSDTGPNQPLSAPSDGPATFHFNESIVIWECRGAVRRRPLQTPSAARPTRNPAG